MNDKIKDIVVTLVFLFTIISLFLINVIKRDTFRKIKIDIELSTKGEYNNLYMYDDYIVEEIFPLNTNSINNLTNKR